MTCPVYSTIKAQKAEFGDDFIGVDKLTSGMCWLEDRLSGRGLRLFDNDSAAYLYLSRKRALVTQNTTKGN